MGMHGITEALNWARNAGRTESDNRQDMAMIRRECDALEREKVEMFERLKKLAEDNMALVQGTNQMLDDHKKEIATLLIEVEMVKSNAAAQAEALTAEVDKLKALLAGMKKTSRR